MTTCSRCLVIPTLLAALAPLMAQQSQSLTILYVNDSHANIAPGAPRDRALQPTVGGIARVATILERERQGHQAVVALHAGDFCFGDPMFNLFFAVPELRLLDALHFDAVAVGNHEFDLSPFGLLANLGQAFPHGASFPLLSANLDLSDPMVQPLMQYVQPYTILDRSGVRVGVFGMTTPTAMLYSQPSPVVIRTDLGLIATQMVALLQAAGCDVVVMLSHLGSDVDEQLAAAVPGIHVIVCGHDHYEFNRPRIVLGPTRAPVYLVQTGGFYRQIGKLELRLRRGGVELLHAELIDLDKQVQPAPAVRAQVDSLKQDAGLLFPGMYSTRVAWAVTELDEKPKDLDRPGRKDTPVGDLLADALLRAGGTDFAVSPGGSTAQPIHRGAVIPEDLFRVVGYGYDVNTQFGWRIATFRTTGLAFWYALEATLAELPQDSDLFVQVSEGITYTYDPSQPVGNRLQSVRVHGMPIDAGHLYSITTNEFVLGFLAYMGVPMFDVAIHGLTEFEALRDHAAGLGVLMPISGPPRVRAVH